MAERRMMAKSIIDTDAFMEMPMSTQCLYFHLLLRADDEGFLQNAKLIIRMTGCKEDDMKLLIAKQYIIPFDTGVIVIRHWKIHNYIQKDRFTPTSCSMERELLGVQDDKTYELVNGCTQNGYTLDTTCIQPVSKPYPQVRLGKDRLGKVSLESDADKSAMSGKATTTTTKADHQSKRFKKPSIEELQAYITEMGYTFSANHFFDYYESNGWKVGRNGMKSWKAACANWQRREHPKTAAGRREIGGWANESDGWGD